MTAKDAQLQQSTLNSGRRDRSHSQTHRARRRKKQGHLVHRLIFNLCLLAGGCALLGTAFHYYYRGQYEESKTSAESIARTERDYIRTGAFTLLGLLPLGLGIRGEALRKRTLEIEASKRAKATRKKSPWPEDQ
jgi:hypothetical protein